MINELVAGDTVDFVDTISGYSSADGWVLKYRLAPRSGSVPVPIDITASSYNGAFRTQVAATVTAAWAPGWYWWGRWLERVNERVSAGEGQINVLPNPATVTSRDTRSHARKCLDAIEAKLENRATKDQEEVSIQGLAVRYMTHEELLNFRAAYLKEVQAEETASAVASGNGNRTKAGVRFNRV